MLSFEIEGCGIRNGVIWFSANADRSTVRGILTANRKP